MEAMRHCVEIAKYLDSSPPVQVQTGASILEIQEAQDKHTWRSKKIVHMLGAIALEIAIKVVWELDNSYECRFTHDVMTLFSELTERSQRELRSMYNEKSAIIAKLEGTDRKGKRIRISDLVEFQSFDEALTANEDTMKNFK